MCVSNSLRVCRRFDASSSEDRTFIRADLFDIRNCAAHARDSCYRANEKRCCKTLVIHCFECVRFDCGLWIVCSPSLTDFILIVCCAKTTVFPFNFIRLHSKLPIARSQGFFHETHAHTIAHHSSRPYENAVFIAATASIASSAQCFVFASVRASFDR